MYFFHRLPPPSDAELLAQHPLGFAQPENERVNEKGGNAHNPTTLALSMIILLQIYRPWVRKGSCQSCHHLCEDRAAGCANTPGRAAREVAHGSAQLWLASARLSVLIFPRSHPSRLSEPPCRCLPVSSSSLCSRLCLQTLSKAAGV